MTTTPSQTTGTNTARQLLPQPRGHSAQGSARVRRQSDGGELRTRVHRPSADSVVIAADGPLDMAGQGLVGDTVRDGLRGRPGTLVLDCSGVSFLDSAGANALIDAAEQGELRAVAVLLVPSAAVERLFDLLELNPRFEQVDSVLAALGG